MNRESLNLLVNLLSNNPFDKFGLINHDITIKEVDNLRLNDFNPERIEELKK